MARKARSNDSASDKLVLVSPDGQREVEVTSAATEAQLRWDGYLPAEQQKLEAPAPSDTGSSSLTGDENTVGTNA